MENASKALIIAGEVLIALLVITMMVLIFTAFGSFSNNMHTKMVEAQAAEFNNRFYSFSHRSDITAQEIVTIINYAKQANDARQIDYNNRTESEYYTTVLINGKDFFGSSEYIDEDEEYKDISKKTIEFLEKNQQFYFRCNKIVTKAPGGGIHVENDDDETDILIGKDTGLVTKINFHKIDSSIITVY